MHNKIILTLLLWASTTLFAFGQDLSLLPKYGEVPKNPVQIEADVKFLSGIDRYFGKDRQRAATESSNRGWQMLQQGKKDDAMRRFNQAWLLNPHHGAALWGMGTLQMKQEKFTQGLDLYEEASQYVKDDIDFKVDHALAIGITGAMTKNKVLLEKAWVMFSDNYRQAPTHTLNLQHWAATLFHTERYADAWQKLILAENTPRGKEVDRGFVTALSEKMPRP